MKLDPIDWTRLIPHINSPLLMDHPLNRYTTWRVGGPGEVVLVPESIEDIQSVLQFIPEDYPVTWLGLGSNVLIQDEGICGLVIVTQGSVLSQIRLLSGEVNADAFIDGISRERTSMSLGSIPSVDRTSLENAIDERLFADNGASIVFAYAGVPCGQLARFIARNHLQGLEFLAGIPGTVGGALAMNAGCYGGETWDQVIQVETIDRQGVRHLRQKNEFEIAYRKALFPEKEYFLAAYFQVKPGNKEESLLKIKTMLDKRNQAQPTNLPNCGSVFKNPIGHHAAALIQACGLKGHRIGGAQISEKHANFIVNIDNASSSDILELIALAKANVKEKFGIELEQEVKIL